MQTEYEYLSGTSISSLKKDRPNTDDTLVISRQQTKVHKNGYYYSQKLNYGDFESTTLEVLSAIFSFGSMAWKDKKDYSKIVHEHSCYNLIQMDFPYENQSNVSSIARIMIDDTIHNLNIPLPVYPTVPEPTPGEIKFVAIPEPKPINVYDKDFNGWVYADGSAYKISDFKYASCFGQCSDDEFCTPVINDIIKIDGRPNQDIDNTIQCQVNDLKQHNHWFSIRFNGNVTGRLSYKSGDWKDTKGAHGTHSSNNTSNGTFNVDVNVNFNDVHIDTSNAISVCEQQGDLTLPTLKHLPVMIYIGKRWEQYDD